MTYTERLKQTYMSARERVIADIERRLRLGQQYSQQRSLLADIDREMQRLGVDTAKLQGVQAYKSFISGAQSAYVAAINPEAMPAAEYFGGLHTKAVEVCVQNAEDYAKITANLIARQAKDRVRELGLQSTTDKLTQNLTWQEQKKELESLLQDDGFVSVPWRSGKGSMRVDSYAELVARTTTNEAHTTGLLCEMDRLGEGLVEMTTINVTCPVCAVRQGRVYRLMDYPDGDERQRFPFIGDGLPRWPAYKTVHPNCRHRLVPYIWTQKSRKEQEDALGHAGDTFEGDPRTEKQIAAYENAQAVKRMELRDRRQYERYCAVLGEKDMPTFSGFRRMKQAGSERYQDMKSDYRYALKVASKDDILLSKYQRNLPDRGKPDSIKDLVDDRGAVKTRRLYDANGCALKDIDTSDHGNSKHHPYGPHAHDWVNGDRLSDRPLDDNEKRQNRDILGGDK